ncbi:hypothetical protein ACIOWE_23315 [Pseudomonas sp. NPDC087598]|uniref:hypothetical protein n=1 Tax=Pseudomonas sp. NPDC087598 TaxID=3364440 RepID=UPI00382C94D0
MNSTMSAGSTSNQQVVFPPDRGLGVLALVPPYPVNFKPQNDGALGININMVYGDRDGLLVYILAYLDMAIGDGIRVFIDTDTVPVAEFSVTDAHFDAQGLAKNIPFFISARDMEARFVPLRNENKDFWYEIRRVSGNPGEFPPRVPLFYKHPAPGEADTDGGKPFNQGLKLPLPSETFVDRSVIDDGMFVTVPEYFNQSIDDVVELAFGSLTLEQTVTAPGDVLFELTPAMLAALASTNSLVVRWQVFDVVENASGWSDSLVLPFKPGVVLLTAPIFDQADPDDVLHHDWLTGDPTTVTVTGVFAVNDIIELTLQGLTKSGDPVSHTYTKTMTVASRKVEFPIENERIRNLIGGALRATYTLTKSGRTQLSKPADVTISGTSQPLGLPILTPLVDGKLPVDTVEATVRFADYWPMKQGATVELRWQTTDQDGITALFIFRQIINDPTLPVIFRIEAKYIAPYASTPLTVQAKIANPGEVEVTSELLQLMFGDTAEIVLEPPFPVPPHTQVIDPLGDLPTIRVEFLAAIAGDKARLVEVKAPNDANRFALVELNKNKRANFELRREFLVPRQNKKIELRWNLNRGSSQAAKSPSLALEILSIASEDSRFPTPQIKPGAELDVTQLQAHDQLTVAQWPGQISGQRLWLRYEEVTNLTPAAPYNDLVGEAHTQLPGLNRELPLNWLKALKNGSTLKISFWVNLASEQEFAQAVLFPVRTYLIKSLDLIAPQLLDLSSPNVDFDDIVDSGARIQVPAYTGMAVGQSVNVELAGTGANHTTDPLDVLTIQPLIFTIPRSVFIANAGRSVAITYQVSSSGQADPVRSPPLTLNVLADSWRDSVTLFNGNAGDWKFGSASRTARIANGYYENQTLDIAGNAGVLLSQTFQFKAARTYRFVYNVANVSPLPENVPPILSVSTSSGIALVARFTVPRNRVYYEQSADFRVPVSGPYTIYMQNHEDRGGYGGAQGGNDFFINAIYVQRYQ